MKAYLRNAGFYSYDAAAADEENPVMRWIGREVKRFLAEADVHVPFLLRVAAAPPDIMGDMAAMQNGAPNCAEQWDDSSNEPAPCHAHAAPLPPARVRQTRVSSRSKRMTS